MTKKQRAYHLESAFNAGSFGIDYNPRHLELLTTEGLLKEVKPGGWYRITPKGIQEHIRNTMTAWVKKGYLGRADCNNPFFPTYYIKEI